MIGAFIVNNSGQNATDDGTITTLLQNFQLAIQASSGRKRLTTTLNIFVNPSGSDTNNGLNQSSPFATIQAAYNFIRDNYDLAGQAVNINLANGTYGNGLVISGQIVGQSAGINVIGNINSPGNVIINSSSNQVNTFYAVNGSLLSLKGMTINSSGTGEGGAAVAAQSGAEIILLGSIIFGAANIAHIAANANGVIVCIAGYTITGAAPVHIETGSGGQIIWDGFQAPITITVSGTPNFSSAFVSATLASTMDFVQTTFTGTATGLRYAASYGSTIDTNGGGANYFPGSSAGILTNGYYI